MEADLDGGDDSFFDAAEEMVSVSDRDSDGSGDGEFSDASHSDASQTDVKIGPRLMNSVSNCLQYEAWTKQPSSVYERRRSFMQLTGIRSPLHPTAPVETSDVIEPEIKPVAGNEDSGHGSSSSARSSSSSRSDYEAEDEDGDEVESEEEKGVSEKNLVCTVKSFDNPDQQMEYVMAMGRDGEIGKLKEVGSNRMISMQEFENNFSTQLVNQLLQKEDEARNAIELKSKSSKKNWMKKLGSKVKIPNKQGTGSFKSDEVASLARKERAMARVSAMANKKNAKELTSLYTRQDFDAHDGPVLVMKFSPDGEYLASAGRDGIVRVWEVSEDARLDESDIPDDDPLCLYFPMNQSSNSPALDSNRKKMKKVKKSRDMACAVLPPRVFWISENPLHEFEGHTGDVLDLSWSKSGYLISSSTDKTARLWKVGSENDECLNVFSHNNYVTSVSFNPMDDDHFISGSIDGFVRMWEVTACKVVHYINLKEIVTAVSYRPNGKEAIVGAMSSNCYFIQISDNQLLMEANISLMNKKKKNLESKRITGFEFCPIDPKKVLITVGDSSIRVLCDKVVICKYKGPMKGGSHVAASFTADGKHIVSANDDSNIRVWNFKSMDRGFSGAKKIRSCESFFSDNAYIAVPWCRTPPATTSDAKTRRAQTLSAVDNTWKKFTRQSQSQNSTNTAGMDSEGTSGSPPTHLPPARASMPKGSVTWPEENIPAFMAAPSAGNKSEYKLLKSAWQSMSNSDNMWGVVIVTAGVDGRIRTYQNYGLPVRI